MRLAVETGDRETVSVLIRNGSVDAPCKHSAMTAIQVACERSMEDIAMMLVDGRCSDPTQCKGRDRSAMELAVRGKHYSLVKRMMRAIEGAPSDFCRESAACCKEVPCNETPTAGTEDTVQRQWGHRGGYANCRPQHHLSETALPPSLVEHRAYQMHGMPQESYVHLARPRTPYEHYPREPYSHELAVRMQQSRKGRKQQVTGFHEKRSRIKGRQQLMLPNVD